MTGWYCDALLLTPHFHALVLDGIYPESSHGLGPFVALPPPETEDVERVLAGTARRIARLIERRALDLDGTEMLRAERSVLAVGAARSR